ncbi:MAG: hypothetical protein L0215_21815 [Gemmataceae bacterium]|nr:hypothetical protein [Gemmataceae bacterium]
MRAFFQARNVNAIFLLLCVVGSAQAQGRVSKEPTTYLPAQFESPPEAGPLSSVAFIDSALPRSMVRLRFDLDYHNLQPLRSEYLFGVNSFSVPERRVDMQEYSTTVEYAFSPWMSVFMESPVRWVNPDTNANEHGVGDTNFGLKLTIYESGPLVGTLQVRGYWQTARHAALGTDHFSLEPALLGHFKINDVLTLEGQVKYWIPMGGGDFEGEILCYGLGLVYGQNSGNEIWLTPVVEVVGWSVLNGKTQIVTSPGTFVIEDASGQTIVNVFGGVRIGLGGNADIYAGYGRCVTSSAWFRDYARVELRILF